MVIVTILSGSIIWYDENCNATVYKGGCNTTAHTCKQCAATADCNAFAYPGGCDTASGACKACSTDVDCSPTDGGMKVGTGKCDTAFSCYTKCATTADCTGVTGFGYKACNSGKCGQCGADADCAGKPLTGCDTATGTCSKCKSNAECATQSDGGMSGITCTTATGACACTATTQCTAQYPSPPVWVCK